MAGEAVQSSGHSVVSDGTSADANILFTCTVIDHTERHMAARMKALAASGKPLVVSGCMATIQKEKILKIAPEAMIVAPSDVETIGSLLGRDVGAHGPKPGGTIPVIERVEAIVPISQGCLGRCTYCITRLARGRLRSYDPDVILARARKYVAAGAKEIRLTSQDTAAYGRDIGLSLADLVTRVASLPGDFMIRVGMANPAACGDILDELVEAYSSPKVYKFLHLPVQSGDDEILEKMNRGYTVADFRSMVLRFRIAHPAITLSTDIIVGFPEETEEQFTASMRLIEELRPDIVNVTRFSPRPMTVAASMTGQLVGWRAKERSRRLSELRFQISRELNSSYEGKTYDATTIERGKKGTTLARTSNYKQVVVNGEIPLGSAIRVRIEKAREVDLLGSLAEPLTTAMVDQVRP